MHATHGDLLDLLDSYTISLEAERKSPKTVEGYTDSCRQFVAWLEAQGHSCDAADVTADDVRRWLIQLGETRADTTVLTRYSGLAGLFTWCVLEGELDRSPMDQVRRPTVRPKVLPMVTDDQLRQLLASCSGSSFADLRDTALILTYADTGARLSEVNRCSEADVDLRARTIQVVGKGGRPRTLAIGARTAKALDRYLRAKRRQPYGERDWLWISSTGKGRFTNNGVQQMLRRRGRKLGLHVHPHMFRHVFADRWLAAGGSETDLMALAGWSSRQMLTRYGAANRAERAREAHRRLSHMDRL